MNRRLGQQETKGLAQKYGDRLVCARYKYDVTARKRYMTDELIEEEPEWALTPPPPRPPPVRFPAQRLAVRVEYWETDPRNKIKKAGGYGDHDTSRGKWATKMSWHWDWNPVW